METKRYNGVCRGISGWERWRDSVTRQTVKDIIDISEDVCQRKVVWQEICEELCISEALITITEEYILIYWVWKFELSDTMWEIDVEKLPTIDTWIKFKKFSNMFLYPRINWRKNPSDQRFYEKFLVEVMKMHRIFFPTEGASTYASQESEARPTKEWKNHYSTANSLASFDKGTRYRYMI